jgi:membrane protease YdiL (CAAX protease family)
MIPAQILIGLIGIIIAAVVFCLLHLPNTRRPQFREQSSLSLKLSLLGAAGVLIVIFLMIVIQGLWEKTF